MTAYSLERDGDWGHRTWRLSGRRSWRRDFVSQAAFASASLAFALFAGACLLSARPDVAADLERTAPAGSTGSSLLAAARPVLDASLSAARAPFLFGSAAPLRSQFQRFAAATAAADSAPAPTTIEAAATALAVEAAFGPDLPSVDIPLPVPRPAGLKSALIAALSPTARPAPGPAPEQPASSNPLLNVRGVFDKLFGSGPQPSGPALAYANPQDGVMNDAGSGRLTGNVMAPAPVTDRQTAIYDISAKVVHMPDGTKLEAHSGLGDMLDKPQHVHVKMRGATPPAVYDLKLREKLFHGVQAIRLTPVNSTVHGRVGLLAHTYMLGPNGDSNGCVSFRDYEAFLQAFLRGNVRRLAVVASMH